MVKVLNILELDTIYDPSFTHGSRTLCKTLMGSASIKSCDSLGSTGDCAGYAGRGTWGLWPELPHHVPTRCPGTGTSLAGPGLIIQSTVKGNHFEMPIINDWMGFSTGTFQILIVWIKSDSVLLFLARPMADLFIIPILYRFRFYQSI
jgi:hypothetical protein